jgi:putative PIN family toxin of toxin-antitoxin system
MRLVLDTAVVVAAVRSARGVSRLLLEAAFDGRLTMLVSVPLMLEYEAVLTRPEHLRHAGLTTEDVATLLDGLAVLIEPVDLAFHWRPTLRDANDDMVLETAVNGRASAIVTFNTRDFLPETRRFGVAVLAPKDILSEMKPS